MAIIFFRWGCLKMGIIVLADCIRSKTFHKFTNCQTARSMGFVWYRKRDVDRQGRRWSAEHPFVWDGRAADFPSMSGVI